LSTTHYFGCLAHDGFTAHGFNHHVLLAGEYLPFAGPIVTEGRPEEWLNRVEEAMFATTKKHLYKVLEESKGESGGGGDGMQHARLHELKL
jgi:hypothetical protein